MHNTIATSSNIYTNNKVGNSGGGLYIYSMAGVHDIITITHDKFINNEVKFGGALYVHSTTGTHSTCTITKSIFTGNTFTSNGGGLQIYSNVETYESEYY